MQTSSSAKRTCRELSSATEYTATVLMPSSRQAKIIRSATSPRFAIRIFLNIYRRAEQAPPLHWRAEQARPPPRSDGGEGLALLGGVFVFNKYIYHLPRVLRMHIR